MPLPVSDSLSNANEQIEQTAKAIGRSKLHRTVFEAIYDGKQRIKTVGEIAKKTRLTRKQVLMSGKRFASQHIVNQVKHDHDTAYEKIDFFHAHKRKILSLAGDPKKLAALPTKRKVGVTVPKVVRLTTQWATAKRITVDDIASFAKVRRVKSNGDLPASVSEKAFKKGVQRILGEAGKFTDWGGERSDLFTTRLVIGGKRLAAAFGFKGPGMTGTLVPGKMGKNGDQIQRLFTEPAQVFVVQYWREVDSTVLEQLEALAVAKSTLARKKIWYGIIDGQDSNRLYRAYPAQFAGRRKLSR
jgi:hypothetical protein